jgi:hypothetical protein
MNRCCIKSGALYLFDRNSPEPIFETNPMRLIPLLETHALDTTPDEEQRRLGGKASVAAGFAATVTLTCPRVFGPPIN